MGEQSTDITVTPAGAGKLNKSSKVLADRSARDTQADYVPHLTLDQVKHLVDTIPKERDRLLIQTLFDGCLRCSEAIGIRPADMESTAAGWQVGILGKGGKRSTVAISATLAAKLQSYCYRHDIKPADRIFCISRSRVFQIVKEAMTRAGIVAPSRARDRVGCVHSLRHSGAIERLRQTGNPRSVQEQLRHKSAGMTLRYLKTISHDESLAIQQDVDMRW